MDACYYCGAPLKHGAAACRFCGSLVDPLDIPLCDSENNNIFDEAPVQQLHDVEYPPLLPVDEIESEFGLENATIKSSGDETESLKLEDVPKELRSVIELSEAVSEELEITPDEPDAEPDKLEAISEEPEIISEKLEDESEELEKVPKELETASSKATETEIFVKNNVDKPDIIQELGFRCDTGAEKRQEVAESELNLEPLFSINTLPGQDQTCVIVKYLGGPVDSLLIPDEIDGLQVKEVGRSAFAHCAVREIILPDSLQHIGDYAFTGCIGLQSIVGGAGVREIGRGVFNGCFSLKKCDFLKNRRIHRPFDSFIDRIISQLSASEKTDNGES